jgi:hypothetical protein
LFSLTNAMSLFTQRYDWVDPSGAQRRHVAGEQRNE